MSLRVSLIVEMGNVEGCRVTDVYDFVCGACVVSRLGGE